MINTQNQKKLYNQRYLDSEPQEIIQSLLTTNRISNIIHQSQRKQKNQKKLYTNPIIYIMFLGQLTNNPWVESFLFKIGRSIICFQLRSKLWNCRYMQTKYKITSIIKHTYTHHRIFLKKRNWHLFFKQGIMKNKLSYFCSK